jgi:CelD/BcsL family acetyltransferase involved in cellulose biosynthesis
MPETSEHPPATVLARMSGVAAPEAERLGVATIDPLGDPRWQRFVESSPSASIFHHAVWLQLLHTQYRYPLGAVCVTDENREIIAGLPLAHVKSRLTGSRLVSVPFADACPPLTRSADERALHVLADALDERRRSARVDIEVRASVGGVGRAGAKFYQHEVPLHDDVEVIRRGFHSSVRRRVSKSFREGVQVKQGTDRATLDRFYALHLITRRRQGVPTQPKSFIRRFASLFEEDLGFVLLAQAQGRTVAAALFLVFNGVLTYKYGASDPRYLQLKPNNAIFMEAIRWGAANGCHTFDLGRTDLDNEGLRSFKRGWGAQERILTYTLLSNHNSNAASKHVPNAARALITRTPPITGRLVGAALYKHFG